MADTYTASADSPDLLWVFDKATDLPVGVATPDGEVVRFGGDGTPGSDASVTAANVSAAISGFSGPQAATAWGVVRPLAGVPKIDLAAAVQTSLNAADTAVQPAALSPVSAAASAAQTAAASAQAAADAATAAVASKLSLAQADGRYVRSINSLTPDTAGNVTITAAVDFAALWKKISAPRGLSEFQRLVDATAAAGITTALLVPPGDYNPATEAQLNNALTLAAASATASTPKVIRIAENSAFALTAQPVAVAPYVSIVSGGNVRLTQTYNPADTSPSSALFRLLSNAEGSPGSQTIRGLHLYGNVYQGASAVYVRGRSNVVVEDCQIAEFNASAITFNGRADEFDDSAHANGEAGVKATGSAVRNCHIFSCSTWIGTAGAGYATGCVQAGSQVRFTLENTVIVAKGRASGLNGYGLKYYRNGWNDGTLIQNCKIAKDVDDGTPNNFEFAVEDWGSRGFECYNSEIEGWFDMNGAHSGGAYTFGAKYMGNVFGTDTLPTNATVMAIELESALGTGGAPCDKIIVEGNLFKNVRNALYIYQKSGAGAQRTRYVSFRNNLCLNTRLGEWVFAAAEGGTQYFDVEFNTFRSTGSFYLHSAVKLPEMGNNSDWNVRSNVIDGTRVAPMWQAATSGGATSNINYTDNLVWTYAGNTNGSTTPVFTTAPTGYVPERNRNTDPLWTDTTGLRHLREGAYGADLNAGLRVGT